MGAVYKARQPALDRLVALKILPPSSQRDPAFAERFTREAVALGKLNHPNIVMVYDFGQVQGLYYFVMEYVDGLNLRELLRSGHMQPAEALKIVPQICDALQFAHDEGIVHRDIKPENILLDKKGRVKIADFGIAKILGAKGSEYTLTGPWQVMGTAHYMAPEQMEKPLSVDHRADIYSLGVVFYELLTGQLPLGRFAPPSRKVQIDVRLDEVVLRALESEPEKRYQHASEVKTEIESLGSESPYRGAFEGWWFGRRPLARGAIKSAVLLMLVGGMIAFVITQQGTLNVAGERFTYVHIGFPDWWFLMEMRPGEGTSYGVNLLSWSFVGGVLAILAIYLTVRIEWMERRRRRLGELRLATAPVPALPLALARALGFEYRSKRTLFGLPLLHIASGIDPVTGRKRIAKGIVAIGDIAIGWLALGGLAMGGICVGGCSLGVIALGGGTLGLVGVGGLGIGLLFGCGGLAVGGLAVGGVAAGIIAYGGMAYGYYSMGGTATGVHAWGGAARDPAAHDFFDPSLAARLRDVAGFMGNGVIIAIWIAGVVLTVIIMSYFRKKAARAGSAAGDPNQERAVAAAMASRERR
jgi:predicted Ser/Thr protein kinase